LGGGEDVGECHPVIDHQEEWKFGRRLYGFYRQIGRAGEACRRERLPRYGEN
jgi:hypothetical protein